MQIGNVGKMAHLICTKKEVATYLEDEFTLFRKHHTEGPVEQIMCQPVKDGLLIPRSHPFVLKANKPRIDRTKWMKDFKGFAMISSLREPQQALVDGFINAINKTAPFGGIIGSPTGSGKTVMGIAIASLLKMPVLVVVPRAVLIEQWKERFKQHTDLTDDDIGEVRQNTQQFLGKKVVIGLVHSLASRTYREELYEHFGLVIFDEVHTMGAETFSRVAHKFEAPIRLGLSATIRRKDGMADAFFWHIGPIVASTQVHKIKPKIVQIRYYNPASSHNGLFWNGKLGLARYINRISAIPARNVFIANLLVALYRKDHHVLLLADRLDMLTELKRLVAGEIGRDKVGLFIGTEKDLGKQILLGTYGTADMGADIPRLTAVVLATPRIDVVQAIGRCLRQGEPVVYDIVDTASSVMQGWAHARMRLYRPIAASIHVKNFVG